MRNEVGVSSILHLPSFILHPPSSSKPLWGLSGTLTLFAVSVKVEGSDPIAGRWLTTCGSGLRMSEVERACVLCRAPPA